MYFNSPTDLEKIKNQTYGEVFKERGPKACLLNVVIISIVVFTSDDGGPYWGYGLLFLGSTLIDVLLPKIIATYKNKFIRNKKK